MPVLVAALVVLGVLVTGGSLLAAPSTDASVNNYQQCANDKFGSVGDPTDCVPQGWINGILNAQNSQYHEDEVTPQRLGLDVPAGGPTTGRTITLRYLARKGQGGGGNHAYDSLATWNVTETSAARCQGLLAADCPGGAPSIFQIPSDPTVVADSNGVGSATSLHELPAAQRFMTMFGGTITDVSVPSHDNASGSGDDFATVIVTYSVSTATDTKVQLLFGGHLAASVGPRGWGANVGSSFINGGPYHIKLDQIDNSSIGNRDNQITSGAILPIGTATQTALHETDSAGVDVNPANNEDPVTETGITVTLPANGSGTYVTDYATVAPPGSTGTVGFRFYATQAACTADSAFTGGTSAGSGKTLDVNSVAKSNPVHITAAGVTYWRAVFTGTGLSASSDSGCSGEILTANQATSTATTLHETNSAGVDVNPANNGDPISIIVGGYATDYASLTPASISSGTVTFRYYSTSTACAADSNATGGSSGGSGTVTSGSAHGSAVQFNSSGTFYWKAFYGGATNINASSSSCEVLNVRQPTSTVTTLHETNSAGVDVNPANNGDPISIIVGGYATDYAAVTPNSATGSVAFKYYASQANCTDDANGTAAGGGSLSSGSAHSNTVQFNNSGTFYWKAFFTGSGLNNASQSSCEALNVGLKSPELSTTPSEDSGAIGDTLSDTGTLSGATSDAGGTVSFYLFKPGDDCSSLGTAVYSSAGVAVSGNGTYDSADGTTETGSNVTDQAGTYHWLAKYSGDDNNAPAASTCADEPVAIGPNSPGLTTIPSETTGRIGDTLSDTGTLSGATSDAGGTVSFYLFAPGDDCSELGTAVYSSTEVAVSGNGTYTSGDGTESGSNTAAGPGTYHWLAKYSGDDNNKAAASECSDEAVLIINPHITILKTPDEQVIVSGNSVSWTIQVINDGDSVLTDVVVTDAQAPGCARTKADIACLASMPPAPAAGSTITYTCSRANNTASFTNVADVTGTPPVGPPVTSEDTAHVTVVPPVTHPAISIVKNPKSQTVTKGGTATFTITVLNPGDVALTDVVVTDALSPNCNKTIGNLAPGQSVSYTCTRPNVQASFTNVAVVTGKAGATTLTDQDTAPVTARAPFVPKVIPKVISHKKPKATG